MDVSRVIEQLRRYCPELGGRVGGAADFETGVESVIAITDPPTGKFVYPAAVAIPLEDETGSNDLLDGNLQIVTETIGVIVEFDAAADRCGQAGVRPVEAIRVISADRRYAYSILLRRLKQTKNGLDLPTQGQVFRLSSQFPANRS